ncbi:MAG: hypothetical protein R2744_07105 [Bacteroidales bacterium]
MACRKMFLILTLALVGLVMVIITSLTFGFIYTREITASMIFSKSGILGVYFIQAIGYMMYWGYFLSPFSGPTLFDYSFLLYFIFIEPIIRLLSPQEIRLWFPVKIVSHLTPPPEILQVASQGGLNRELTFGAIGLMSRQLPHGVNLAMAIVYIVLFAFLHGFWIRRGICNTLSSRVFDK